MSSIYDPISKFDGIAKIKTKKLEKLGVHTLYDLLLYIPARYDDLSEITHINDLVVGSLVTIRGRIDLINNTRSPRKRMYITESLVSDDTGSIKIIWFNQPFLAKSLKVGDIVFFSGKVENNYLTMQMTNPSHEKETRSRHAGNTLHTGRIVPIYPLTSGISNKQIRFLVKKVLPLAFEAPDILPENVKKSLGISEITETFQHIHFPESKEHLKKALYRLKFEELFILQLFTQKLRYEMKKQPAFKVDFKEDETKAFVNNLPFDLTFAQKRAAWDILQNLETQTGPMNRLVEGDVGSGKTIVCIMATLNVYLNGFQSLIMAPTEILAKQHFETFIEYLGETEITIGLLTRTSIFIYNQKDGSLILKKKQFIEMVKNHEIDIIIGTHSLLNGDLQYDNVALMVVDEQHRFGVKQRQYIKEWSSLHTGQSPHFLSMTATPIPRSLALALYGDLDLSIIDEMPKGRKKVITKFVHDTDRKPAYDFIEKQIESGHQIFVICPLITESDKLGVKSVNQEFKRLSEEIFPQFEIGMLHGKLKKKEKDEVMEKFIKNDIQILVSTSVIEVGVNIPNATVMMIEGADRFGLAQLHQFRGRVGRSSTQSYCFIFSDVDNDETKSRLEAFTKSHNGFDLAQKDLEIRGPGEVYGTKQSGLLGLKYATLADMKILKDAQNQAKTIIEHDPELENYPQLKEKVSNMEQLFSLE